MRYTIALWQYAKRAEINFGDVAKVTLFLSLCLRNLLIAFKADHVSNIPLRELNLEKKTNGGEFNILFTICCVHIHEGLTNYTLIWRNGTFKVGSCQ